MFLPEILGESAAIAAVRTQGEVLVQRQSEDRLRAVVTMVSRPASSSFSSDRPVRETYFHAIRVPPVRERGRDIFMLADHLLTHFCDEYGTPGLTLSDNAKTAMLDYSWPGNVRELAIAIERAVRLCDYPVITEADPGLIASPWAR